MVEAEAKPPPFDWPSFFEAAKEDIAENGATPEDVVLKTEQDEEGGLPLCVLDPSAEDFPVVFASRTYARLCGCSASHAPGTAWESIQLPDDKVQNKRLNGEELEMLSNYFTAYADHADRRAVLPIVVFLLSERRGGERFWSVVRCSRVFYRDKVYIALRAVRLNMPTLEVLEGLQPSIEARAKVEELLMKVREDLRICFADGQEGATMSGLARLAEEEVGAWLQAGNAGGSNSAEVLEVPPSGINAYKDFEANNVWTTLFSPAEQRIALASEDTAWTVQDLDADQMPLVFMTPMFATITGYGRDWMLGRNNRFLQPCDPGRNEVFNGEELRRVKEFTKGRDGVLTSLVLNQKADGSFFWNLIVMEIVVFKGHAYMIAANKQLTLHQELLSMMNTWDHRSLGYISSLRLLLTAREAHLSPMPARSQANEPMIAECFLEWSENIRQDLSDFWEGDHFVPPIGGLAVQTFEGRWAPLVQKAEENIKKVHCIQESTLSCMKENQKGGVVCCVADPTSPDCPLVFVSAEFENQTAYKREFALGRNCRFLQPNNRQFNIMVNGGEVATMRHFCTLLSDFTVGTELLNLLLNEKRSGERFWNLLHMSHVDVAGRRYILGVQTVLDLPIPAFLKTVGRQSNVPLSPEDACRVEELCKFLSGLRAHLRSMAQLSALNIKELSKSMHAQILDYIKNASDDFEGDHYVPKVGEFEAQQFETDRKWAKLFSEVAEDMKEIFEATEDTYAKTAADSKGAACCSVADPSKPDCPLLYISTGFEQLTGYHRDWALGRNCRFLQPNAKAFNDAFNLWERSQMREFCAMPPKTHRQLTLLINEARDGYPFWNALVMKHVKVGDSQYIFGVQTNILKHLNILGELLAGGPDGFRELGRLRAVLRAKSAKLGSFSLASLLDECLGQWISTLPSYVNPLRFDLPLAQHVSLPAYGIELARNEQHSLEEKVLAAIDEGVRHFHLNFAIQTASQTTDVEGRLFALRVVEALAVLKQRHLHYLRDCIVFSIRAKPSQRSGSLELLQFLQSAGFRASLWLLDVTGSNIREISDVWPDLDNAVREQLVETLGLFGGGPAEFAAVGENDLVKPMVQALDIYVGVQWNCRQWVHLSKLSQSGVKVMTCKPLGPRGTLLSNAQVRVAAKELGIDPAMLLLKWAEGLGYLCVTPQLRVEKMKIEKNNSDLPFVLNGTRRTFVKEYAAAPSGETVLPVIKRRFPTLSLDHVRSAAQKEEANSPANRQRGGAAFGSSQVTKPLTKSAPKPRPKPAATAAAPKMPSSPSKPSGGPMLSRPAPGSPTSSGPLHRSPPNAAAAKRRAASPSAANQRAQSPTSQHASVPSSPVSPGSPPRRTPGGVPGRGGTSPLRGTRQSPGSPVSPVGFHRMAMEKPAGPVSPKGDNGDEAAENTDVSNSSDIQKKQQELAKREVELMLRELQLEQRLLKEEQRLLDDKSASKS
jgi:diketogulonate reductase-like aldo/keto reductase